MATLNAIGIVVSDMSKALAFYRLLGLEIPEPAESEEMKKDRDYLDTLSAKLAANGFTVDAILANGDPAGEIAGAAVREKCDLIAMGTHGHRFVKDLLYGSVANELRHQTMVPVLMVRDPQ